METARPYPNTTMSIHVQLSTEAQARLNAQKRTSTISSIVISILVIVMIFLVLGIFLLPKILKENPTIVTYSASLAEEPDLNVKKIQTQVKRKPSASTNSMAKVIAANSTSPTAIPVPDIDVVMPNADFGDGDDFGAGWGAEDGSVGGGTVFGRQINSSNLGVVLDISGSAHSYLAEAIAEIDKSFPTAHIILVVGCGMSDGNLAIESGDGKVPGKPRIVDFKDMDSEKKYNSFERSAPGQMELFYKQIGSKRSNEIKNHFKNRNNLSLLYGGDTMATHHAFEFALDKKGDTIYWFADFADSIDEEIIEKLTKKLKRNKTTVISHNFLGSPVGKLAKEMSLATGGSVVELIPGQKSD